MGAACPFLNPNNFKVAWASRNLGQPTRLRPSKVMLSCVQEMAFGNQMGSTVPRNWVSPYCSPGFFHQSAIIQRCFHSWYPTDRLLKHRLSHSLFSWSLMSKMVWFRYSKFNLPFLTIKRANSPDNYNEQETILHLTSRLYLKKDKLFLVPKVLSLEFAAQAYSKPKNASC